MTDKEKWQRFGMRLVFYAILFGGWMLWKQAHPDASVTIITCEIQQSSSEWGYGYYSCGPRVAFMLVPDSVGDLRLKDLIGKTVDLQVNVVK